MPSLLKQTAKSYQPITPTSNPWLQMQYDIKNYKQHWHNVTHAKALVDHSAPPLLTSYYVKTQQLAVDEKRLQQVDRENKKLLQRINIINRTTGKVDSHMREYTKSSNKEQRKIEARLIAKYNLEILQRLMKVGPNIVPTRELLADYERIEKVMSFVSRYPLFWKKKRRLSHDDIVGLDRRWTIRNESIITIGSGKIGARKIRPRVFLDIANQDGEKLGRMIIELYNDVVPLSAENFRSLCQGDNTDGMSYQDNPFCRIIPGLYCQAGDITQLHGSGGKSIYGDTFLDENFHLQHGGPGVVTMHNTGPNTNNSQFMITFKALHTLDGNNVVIGKIIKGFQTLYRVEEYGTSTGKILRNVYIKDCGEIDRLSEVPVPAPPVPVSKDATV